jgi:hypothetical protein
MFVLDAFKGHSAPESISVICAISTDLVIMHLVNKPFKDKFYSEWLLAVKDVRS